MNDDDSKNGLHHRDTEHTEREEAKGRMRNFSPGEEARHRMGLTAAPERLPDHAVAMLMQKQQFVTVRNCELRFEVNGTPRVYTRVDSVTCQPGNEGRKVLVSYALDFPEAIFVLSDAGGYIETVPLKRFVKWFDSAAAADSIRDSNTRLNRARANLEELHADETMEKAGRMERNADKAEKALRPQMVRTFRPGNRLGTADATPARIQPGARRGAATDRREGPIGPDVIVGNDAEAESQRPVIGGATGSRNLGDAPGHVTRGDPAEPVILDEGSSAGAATAGRPPISGRFSESSLGRSPQDRTHTTSAGQSDRRHNTTADPDLCGGRRGNGRQKTADERETTRIGRQSGEESPHSKMCAEMERAREAIVAARRRQDEEQRENSASAGRLVRMGWKQEPQINADQRGDGEDGTGELGIAAITAAFGGSQHKEGNDSNDGDSASRGDEA
jgi:hypothetical protein